MLKAMLSQPIAGKIDEKIVSWLNQHIFFESGYDITEGPFPLPATIGEGFRFQSLDIFNKNVVDYVTKASRKNGKRVLRFRISTFIGLCGGACHYFCKAYSAIYNTDVNDASHYISGYITDVDGKAIDIPSESRSLAFDIGAYVAGYIEDKYIILGFDDYTGCILCFTSKVKNLCGIYHSYRFAKLKYLEVIKHQ